VYTKLQKEHISNLFTLEELMHGAEKSSRRSENLLYAIEDFCSRLEVLPYGATRATLEKLGEPIAKLNPTPR